MDVVYAEPTMARVLLIDGKDCARNVT